MTTQRTVLRILKCLTENIEKTDQNLVWFPWRSTYQPCSQPMYQHLSKCEHFAYIDLIRLPDIDASTREINNKQHLVNTVFFNWDSLYTRLNSHYEAWSYKKKEKTYRKSVLKEPTLRRCLWFIELKPFWS